MNYTNGQNPFDNGYTFYDDIVAKDAKRTSSKISLGMVLFIVGYYVFVIALQFAVILLAGERGLEALLTNRYFSAFVGFFCMYLIGLPLLWLMIRKLPKRMVIKKESISASEFLALIPIGQFLMYAGAMIGLYADNIASFIFGKEISNPVTDMAESMPIWLFVIITLIVGPFVEEFIFRGLLFDRLAIYGNIFATIFTAIVFGLFHGNLQQLYYAFFLGLVLGYVRSKTGSYKIPFILHALMNFISGVIPTLLDSQLDGFEKALDAYLVGDGDVFIENISSFMIYGSYSMLQTVLMIAGGIILFRMLLKKKIIFKNDPEIEIPKRRLPAVIFKNVGVISLIAVSLFLFLLNYI